jgi:hypothetical protein
MVAGIAFYAVRTEPAAKPEPAPALKPERAFRQNAP